MFRLWAKVMKDNRMIDDMVVANEDRELRRTQKVFAAIDEICDTYNLSKPIWLDATIKDFQRRVLNVVVDHDIYGEIATELIIRNRSDVYDFVKKVKEKKIVPLKELTFDVHLHTVEADSEEILDRVEEALREKNYLV